MKAICIIIPIFFSILCYAQNDLRLGKIIPEVKLSSHPEESFALYLPTTYDKSEQSSIVFVFDPMGNGSNGLRSFISSAERFNHILIASNQARNGPYDRNFEITNRLFDHVFKNYKIDSKQIYLSGFSGGSRFATSVAVLTDKIRAVIACGAGFAFEPNYIPTRPKFLYTGVIGNKDMNLREMTNNYKYLDSLKFRHQLFQFEGVHQWPPKESLETIFTWLDVQAYTDGIKQIPDERLLMYYQDLYNDASHSINNITKLERLKRLHSTFNNIYNLDSIAVKISSIEKSKDYIKDQKKLKRIFNLETRLANNLARQYRMDHSLATKVDFNWWEKEIKKLDKLSSRDLMHADMVYRIKYNMFAFVYESVLYTDASFNPFQKELYDFIIKEFRD